MTILGFRSSLLVIINQVLRIQIAVKSDVKTGGNYDVIGQFHRSLKEFNKKLIVVTSCLDAVVAGIMYCVQW